MKSTFSNIQNLLQSWIDKYYERLTENPKVRAEHITHLKLIEEVNKHYLKDLTKHYKRKILTEEPWHLEAFKKQIDFLTSIYKEEKKLEEKKAIRERLTSIPNRHYKPQL